MMCKIEAAKQSQCQSFNSNSSSTVSSNEEKIQKRRSIEEELMERIITVFSDGENEEDDSVDERVYELVTSLEELVGESHNSAHAMSDEDADTFLVMKDGQSSGLSKDQLILSLLFKVCQTVDPSLTLFLRSALQLKVQRIISDVDYIKRLLPSQLSLTQPPILSENPGPISLFKLNFEQIFKIGEGAFGNVYKVRNKDDEKFYAMKIIDFTSRALNDPRKCRAMREVQNLSGLYHDNIVRYNFSWIEACSAKEVAEIQMKKELDEELPYVQDDLKPTRLQKRDVMLPQTLETDFFQPLSGRNSFLNPAMRSDSLVEPLIRRASSEFLVGSPQIALFDEDDFEPIEQIRDLSATVSDYQPFNDLFGSGSWDSPDESLVEWSSDEFFEPFEDGFDSSGSNPEEHFDERSLPGMKLSPSNDNLQQQQYHHTGGYLAQDFKNTISGLNIHYKLYLQMEYAGAWILKDYLDNKERVPQECEIVHIIKHILQGVELVHQAKLVHRDIKPANIFIDTEDVLEDDVQLKTLVVFGEVPTQEKPPLPLAIENWLIKIGDFGLARRIDEDVQPPETDFETHDFHNPDSLTVGLGTWPYGAPEQWDLQEDHHYHQKADIFSVGIILFELMHDYIDTDHERISIMEDCRKGIVPPHLYEKFPHLSDLCARMLCANPEDRPTTVEALSEINHLQNAERTSLKFKNKQELIDEIMNQRMEQAGLKDELSKQGEELLKLKEVLRQHGIIPENAVNQTTTPTTLI